MTNKIPYDVIAIEANKLIIRMALSTHYNYSDNYKLYLAFIEACGWSDKEYDEETLIRIDRRWDFLFKSKNTVWN